MLLLLLSFGGSCKLEVMVVVVVSSVTATNLRGVHLERTEAVCLVQLHRPVPVSAVVV